MLSYSDWRSWRESEAIFENALNNLRERLKNILVREREY